MLFLTLHDRMGRIRQLSAIIKQAVLNPTYIRRQL